MKPLGSYAGARIVFTNWRDLRHPSAGGAEVDRQRVAELFAEAGAQVELLTAAVEGAPAHELVNGVRIHRMGNALHGPIRSRYGGFFGVAVGSTRSSTARPFRSSPARRLSPDPDRVCDPPRPSGPVLALPAASGGGHRPDPRRLGHAQDLFGPTLRGRLALHACRRAAGADAAGRDPCAGERHRLRARPDVERSDAPRIVSVGRLVAHKRLDYLLESLREILNEIPDVHLDVVGDGPARASLEALASELGIDDSVTFHGFVSEEEKRRLVVRGWVTAITSLSEGSGLTIVEANALASRRRPRRPGRP